VINNVPDGQVILGAPAIEAGQGRRAYGMIRNLPEMRQNMRRLQSRLEKIAARLDQCEPEDSGPD
jgi:hypothetical protein